MRLPIAITVTPGSQTSARACTCDIGRSMPLMSTIRMLGDRSARQRFDGLRDAAAHDRAAGEGQLRQAFAQSLLGRGIGDEGQQRGSADGQSVGGFLDRRGHLRGCSSLARLPPRSVSTRLTFLTALSSTPRVLIIHCLTDSTPLLPRMTSTGGRSAGITFSGHRAAQCRRHVTRPGGLDAGRLAGPGGRGCGDAVRAADAAQGQRQFAELGGDVDLLGLIGHHLERAPSGPKVFPAAVFASSASITSTRRFSTTVSLTERRVKRCGAIVEFLGQDHVDAIAGI